MNKALVLLSLVAVAMVVAVPTASAHFVIGYEDPTTGECKAIEVPVVSKYAHGGAGFGNCRIYHT